MHNVCGVDVFESALDWSVTHSIEAPAIPGTYQDLIHQELHQFRVQRPVFEEPAQRDSVELGDKITIVRQYGLNGNIVRVGPYPTCPRLARYRYHEER